MSGKGRAAAGGSKVEIAANGVQYFLDNTDFLLRHFFFHSL